MDTRPGERRPLRVPKARSASNLSIPDQREVNEPLLSALVKEMGLTVADFLRLARK